jgi:hypothetical protein
MGNLVECISVDCSNKDSENDDFNIFDDKNNGKNKQIELYPNDDENNIYQKHYLENSINYDNNDNNKNN